MMYYNLSPTIRLDNNRFTTLVMWFVLWIKFCKRRLIRTSNFKNMKQFRVLRYFFMTSSFKKFFLNLQARKKNLRINSQITFPLNFCLQWTRYCWIWHPGYKKKPQWTKIKTHSCCKPAALWPFRFWLLGLWGVLERTMSAWTRGRR